MHLATLLIALSAAIMPSQTRDTLETAQVTGAMDIAAPGSAPLQYVQAEKMHKQGNISLTEALRSFSGISIKDYGGIGGLKTVNIRGLGANHSGIVYDGTVISDAQNGQVDIGRFNLEGLEGIRVEIGGSDNIFRSARLASYAGTVTLESSKPDSSDTALHASARLRYASFNSWNPGIGISKTFGNGKGDSWHARMDADYLDSRGNYPFTLINAEQQSSQTRLNSDVRRLKGDILVVGLLRGSATENQSTNATDEIRIRAGYHQSERGLPGSVVLYTQNPTERLWDRDFNASVSYTSRASRKWRIRSAASYSSRYNRYVDSNPYLPSPVDDRYNQQEAVLEATGLWSPLEGLDLSLAQDITYNYLDANLASCLFPHRLGSYTAASAKYSGYGITASATLLGTVVREWVQRGEAAPERNRLSPSASISYRLPAGFVLRASTKDGYRLPTFNDMYYPRSGNKSINPEKAWQNNLGIVWQGIFRRWHSEEVHSISISADAYYNSVRDKIVAVPSLFVWSMRNVGRVSMSGCDLSASYSGSFGKGIGLKAGIRYSCQHAVDISDPSAKNYGHQIAYTPRNCGGADLLFETPWFNIGYTLQAVGERYSLAMNSAEYKLDPYADHSISINGRYSIGRRLALSFSAEALNLADVNYEVIKYYPMPGRNYRITIKIQY